MGLSDHIQEYRSDIDRKISGLERENAVFLGTINEKKRNLKELQKLVQDGKHEYKILENALDVLRMYGIIKEQVLREKIDVVVTQGLKLIFGDEYKSKLEFKISRGQAVLIPKIVSLMDGQEIETSIEDSRGGGIANVCSVLYQIIVLSLVEPKQKKIFFADEPFRNLSQEHLESAGDFLKVLSERLNIQIVLITHRKELQSIADKLYKFKNINGETEVEKIH